jgi:ubiquitin carboxyl-terminal hydrolase 25/28
LEHTQKATAEESKDSAPPPLPARPSPSPPSTAEQKQDLEDGESESRPLQLDLTGNDSAETLIGHEEIDSEPSYEKVEHVTSHTNGLDSPSPVVEIKNDDLSPSKITETSVASNGQGPFTLFPPTPAETAEDIEMEQADEPESVDKKVLNALEHQTRSSGTDQQDVEEVIGSILNRLQAAIQPSQIDEKTGIQLEKIMETFFVTTVNYTKKFDKEEYQPEVSFDRSITAYPAPDGTCSLYEALGRNFDQFIIEDERLSRYTAIKTLPPVLHVLIQRSQNDGRKNGNAVEIPETLYLDRYMDAAHDSPAFRRRVEDWSIAARIEELKAQKAQLDSDVSTGRILESIRLGMHAASEQVLGSLGGTSSVFDDETWDFDGPVDDDFMLVNPVPAPEPVEDLSRQLPQEEMNVVEKEIQGMMETELQQREQTLAEHQAASKEVPYRLHAVICHRGHLGSGHYWVWIRDFEENVWRWYNDADVKENKDTDDVLKTLSSSGEPYYLCYVRDSDKDEHVDVPKRQRPEVVEEPVVTVAESRPMPDAPPTEQTKDADGDVVVGDSAVVDLPQDWGKPQSTAGPPQGGGDGAPDPPPYGDW